MIDSASGYECVNVSGLSGFITGEILPKRDIAADGSWARQKYEDYLFLLEAKHERENWDTTPSATVSPKGRLIKGLYISATQVQSSTVSSYFKKDIAIPTGLVSTTSSATIMQAMNAAVSLQTVSIGSSLKADTMRKLFWNIAQLKRSTKSITWSDIATGWTGVVTYTLSDGTSAANPPTDSPNRLWAHARGSRVGSPHTGITISYKSSFGTFPWATGAILFLKVTSYNEDSGAYFYDVVAVRCSVSNGTVSVPSLSGVAQTACAAHGMTYTAFPSRITSGGGSVDITSYLLVVENDFPAEIDSLNWNWQPT